MWVIKFNTIFNNKYKIIRNQINYNYEYNTIIIPYTKLIHKKKNNIKTQFDESKERKDKDEAIKNQ